MESHGKAQRQRRNICVSLLIPGGGIGSGNGTGPRVFLEILPCAKTRSIIKADLNFQHFCLSFLLVLFGFGEHLELRGQSNRLSQQGAGDDAEHHLQELLSYFPP